MLLQFLKNFAGYNAGERATFDPGRGEAYVRAGAAVEVGLFEVVDTDALQAVVPAAPSPEAALGPETEVRPESPDAPVEAADKDDLPF